MKTGSTIFRPNYAQNIVTYTPEKNPDQA